MRGFGGKTKINKKRILRLLGLLILLYFIWVGYFNKYNTYIAVSDYIQDKDIYDIEIVIDGESKIIDTVNPKEYSWPGKIHPVKVNSGYHRIIAKSNALNMVDSSTFLSIGYSHFYIEFVRDTFDYSHHILIDKRYGKTIIFE